MREGRIIPPNGDINSADAHAFASNKLDTDKEFNVDLDYPFAFLMHDFTSMQDQREEHASFYFEVKPKS